MIALLLALFSQPALAQAPSVRGYFEVEQELGERMLTAGMPFSFATLCLQSPDSGSNLDTQTQLLKLLGAYQSAGNNEFVNGDPNAVSLLIWQLLLQQTGREILRSFTSDGDPSLPLNPFFRAAVSPLLRWPAAEAQTDSALRGFWLAVVGYDAPEEEFLAWKDFALHSSISRDPAVSAVPKLFFLATFNPHFLLRK